MPIPLDDTLTAYGELAVKVALNLQPGQRLLIIGPLAAGATETLELYSDAFHVVRHGRSTYYRLKESQS